MRRVLRVSPEVVAVNGADVSRLSLVPCGDQLRTGAALNAVCIAKGMLESAADQDPAI
ncbi:MAG: hypothetical protein MK074_05295 [Phycisphaerales bacterium]|nr:hypothetical protein [Phycisphaerales bacterium]